VRLAVAAALALAGLAAPAAAIAQAVEIALRPGEVLLNVEGDGEDLSRPDVMTVRAGAITTGSTARAALEANNALANRLVEAVRSSGVEARDVRTANLSVRPRFNQDDEERAERDGRRPQITGYIAQNSLELRLRNLAAAPQILDALFAAGANHVEGPSFTLSDPKPAQARARIAAIADAQAEAAAYAEGLGMRIARILRVSQRGNFNMEQGGDSIVVTGALRRGTPVEPGEIRTAVRVWIDYAMVPK
jgi:uncharacterized protein YggE